MYAFENYLEEDKGQLPEYMPGSTSCKCKVIEKSTKLPKNI